MSHLEGVLTLVSDSGPWFRIQGRHLRESNAQPASVRLSLDPSAGILLDVHLGSALWVRAGWYPSHLLCQAASKRAEHRCFGRWLRPWVGQTDSI